MWSAGRMLVGGCEGVGRRTGEGDGDEEQVLLSGFDVGLDGFGGLRSEPGRRSNLGLPDEAVRVREAEFGHDGVDGRRDLGGIWITYLISISPSRHPDKTNLY